MQEYKLRVFHKDIINENGVFGKIEILAGSKERVIHKIRQTIDNARKIIVEVR